MNSKFISWCKLFQFNIHMTLEVTWLIFCLLLALLWAYFISWLECFCKCPDFRIKMSFKKRCYKCYKTKIRLALSKIEFQKPFQKKRTFLFLKINFYFSIQNYSVIFFFTKIVFIEGEMCTVKYFLVLIFSFWYPAETLLTIFASILGRPFSYFF